MEIDEDPRPNIRSNSENPPQDGEKGLLEPEELGIPKANSEYQLTWVHRRSQILEPAWE